MKITNTSSTAFKSMAISTRDMATDVTLSDTRDGFQDVDGCLPSAITGSVEPCTSYTIVSPTFVADPTGHKMIATIKLCTETGLGVSCTSKTIEFTPYK